MMLDRGKVVRHIKAEIEIAKICKKDFASVDIDILSDAYELLKEQEPIEPIAQLDRDEDYIFLCSNCKGEIFGGDILHDNYCTTCGRLVNWHGRY